MTIQRALHVAALALVLAGVVIRFHGPVLPAAPAARATAPPSAERARPFLAATADSSAFGPIIAADIFSPTRQPPTVRFSPAPEQPVVRSAVAIAPSDAAAAEPDVALLGTTIAPGGVTALLAVNGAGTATDVYRVGDRVAGGSVVAITDSTVVIVRSGGRLVLRLPPITERRP